MRVIITRVTKAELSIEGEIYSKIERGFLVLVGITQTDTQKEAKYLAEKCVNLRVFEDEDGKMNKALADVGGEIMAVSNFTLYANCAHGRRPDFLAAAKPDISQPLYDYFVEQVRQNGAVCKTGVFGADMQIDHVNDGPVTIIMDTAEMMK